MPDLESWKAVIAAIKDLAEVLLKIFGVILQIVGAITLPILIYLNMQNGTKLDTAKEAVVTQAAVVKQELSANKVETDKTLSDLAGKLDVGVAAAVSTNAINTKWVADKSGNPDDMAEAQAAENRLKNLPAAAQPPP